MNVLITGSNGYIGSSLSHGLSDSHEITLLTREMVNLLDTDSVDKFFSDKFFDVILHCASVGGNRLHKDDTEVTNQNLKIYQNIHNNKNHFNKLISFGTGVELNETTPYSIGKRLVRDSIVETPNFYNIRVYAVFDENELDRRFIKSNLMKCVGGEPMVIHQNKYMDFFYMGDLINLVKYYISENNPPKEVDCSYKNKTTLKDITQLIDKLFIKSTPTIIKKDGMGKIYVGNNLFLNKLPLTLIGLEEGIKRTYNKCI
jgi:dTDP-4-dehydrorhamnose reductase